MAVDLRKSMLISQILLPFCNALESPERQGPGSQTAASGTGKASFFKSSCPNRYEGKTHHGFDLHFPND